MATDPAFVTNRLNVNDYVEARSHDIKRLEELITNSGSRQKKRAFQSLPRVERRRAASHDPKRVPRKRGLRKQAEFETLRDNAKKRKVRSRSHPERRDSHEVVDLSTIGSKSDFNELHKKGGLRYSSRQRDKVWLPTHIWHRKRAFLKNIGGFLVPETATQKQYRRTYRLTSHIDERGAIAWDTSYDGVIIARGHALKEQLATIFPGFATPIYRTSVKVWQGMVPEIGPVLVHWYDSAAVAVHCHPLIFDDIWDLLQLDSIELEDCRYAIGSIDLAGPSAIEILSTVISGEQLRRGEFCDWNEVRSFKTFPDRAALNFIVKDPRLQNSGPDSQILERDAALGSESSVYVKSCRLESLKKQLTQSEVDKLRHEDHSTPPQIPMTIFSLSDGRTRIVLPWNWVLPFWLSIFRRRHILVGGQQELQQLSFEKNVPFFPRDFPYTRAGAEFDVQRAQEKEAVHSRKPKAKRSNFSNEIGNPFLMTDLSVLSSMKKQFSHVSLAVLVRGVPQPGARIFKLLDAVEDTVITTGRIEDSNKMTESDICGFVTSGNFQLTSSKGAGMGLINECISGPQKCIVRNPGATSGFIALMKPI